MSMKTFALALVIALVGCGGDDGDPTPTIDAPAGNACTGALYDPCTDNSQCMSGNCRMFNNTGIQVCTQDCSSMACPAQGGTAVMCSTGQNTVCRPTMANACTR